jgi:NAD(P)-dependent dehydrogenase (short-subunit alcohol dehydrogenase family)
MRILIAGASGAIGRPLVRRLRANQHEVFALTRSPDSAPALKEIGAEPVIADALDAAAVKAAVGRIRPDAVINQLTSLPRHYTPAEMKAAAERDRKVRVEGAINPTGLLLSHCQWVRGLEVANSRVVSHFCLRFVRQLRDRATRQHRPAGALGVALDFSERAMTGDRCNFLSGRTMLG